MAVSPSNICKVHKSNSIGGFIFSRLRPECSSQGARREKGRGGANPTVFSPIEARLKTILRAAEGFGGKFYLPGSEQKAAGRVL